MKKRHGLSRVHVIQRNWRGLSMWLPNYSMPIIVVCFASARNTPSNAYLIKQVNNAIVNGNRNRVILSFPGESRLKFQFKLYVYWKLNLFNGKNVYFRKLSLNLVCSEWIVIELYIVRYVLYLCVSFEWECKCVCVCYIYLCAHCQWIFYFDFELLRNLYLV